MAKFLRSIGMMVMAGALLSGSARAADAGSGDGAWATKYGMLFTIQNVFGQDATKESTLGDMGGSVGLQYNLGPQRALRLQVGLSRASKATTEQKTTDLQTGTTTTAFSAPTDYTSLYDVDLGAAYMMRLTSASIAPYLGAGGGIGYSQRALKYENDVSSTVTTFNKDLMDRTISLNAAGILGLEWRVHKSIALFAEYTLGVSLIEYDSFKDEEKTTTNATGAVNGDRVKRSSTTFLNFDTGIGQGGMIGLLAFF
jgi:hypothetical protein